MGRVALLANPEAGAGDANKVERGLRDHGAAVVRFAIEDAEAALQPDVDRLVVAGGDGSIGVAAHVASRAGVPLAVVPVGTANDFATSLELPDDPADAVRVAVEGRRTRRLELGLMSGGAGEPDRPFVNVASLGLPPAAAERARGLKAYLGPLAYAVGAVRAAATADPVHCRIADRDGRELFADDVWQATIACTGRFGAGSRLDADPTDGMLDAVAVEAGSRLSLARRARGMRAGVLEEQEGVHRARSAEFTVGLDAETRFNVDGEVCTRAGDVRFKIAPERVDVVIG